MPVSNSTQIASKDGLILRRSDDPDAARYFLCGDKERAIKAGIFIHGASYGAMLNLAKIGVNSDPGVIHDSELFENVLLLKFEKEMKLEDEKESGETNETASRIVSKNVAKQIFISEVLIPDEPMALAADGFRDVIDAENIQKAAWDFNSQVRKFKMGHSGEDKAVDLYESWIAPMDFVHPENGRKIKKGTWLITAKVNDEEVWKRIEDGTITGVSIGGLTKRKLAYFTFS